MLRAFGLGSGTVGLGRHCSGQSAPQAAWSVGSRRESRSTSQEGMRPMTSPAQRSLVSANACSRSDWSSGSPVGEKSPRPSAQFSQNHPRRRGRDSNPRCFVAPSLRCSAFGLRASCLPPISCSAAHLSVEGAVRCGAAACARDGEGRRCGALVRRCTISHLASRSGGAAGLLLRRAFRAMPARGSRCAVDSLPRQRGGARLGSCAEWGRSKKTTTDSSRSGRPYWCRRRWVCGSRAPTLQGLERGR